MKPIFILLLLLILSCKSSVNTTTEKVIVVDDSPEEIVPSILEYKQLVYSQGDTAITNDGDLIILDDRSYVSLGTTAWINRKVVIVYK